jgi:hypothetical protein
VQVSEIDTARHAVLSLRASAAEAAELRAQIDRMDRAFFDEVAKAVRVHARADSEPQLEQCVALRLRLCEWRSQYAEYADDSRALPLGDVERASACELASSLLDCLFRVSAERRSHASAHESELRALREQLMATTKQCDKDRRRMAAESELAKAQQRAHIERLSADVVSEAEEAESLTRQLEIADARSRDACAQVADAHALKLHKMRQAAEADAAVASLSVQLNELTYALGAARAEASAPKASACVHCEQLLRDEQQSGASTGSPASLTPAGSPVRERLTSERLFFGSDESHTAPPPPAMDAVPPRVLSPPLDAQELLDLKRLKMKLQRAAAQVVLCCTRARPRTHCLARCADQRNAACRSDVVCPPLPRSPAQTAAGLPLWQVELDSVAMVRELEAARSEAAALRSEVERLRAALRAEKDSSAAKLEKSRATAKDAAEAAGARALEAMRKVQAEQQAKEERQAAASAAEVGALRAVEARLVARVSELEAALGAQTERSAALSQQAASLFKDLTRARR